MSEVNNALEELKKKYVAMDREKAKRKEWEDEYYQLEQDLFNMLGVGNHFQDDEGIVYQAVVPDWKSVKMDHAKIIRTKRLGEAKGDLAVKKAQELGYEVK